MAIFSQFSKTPRVLLFILLLMSLFWESCNNSKKQTFATTSTANDTLPDKLDALKAATLIKNFQSADDQLSGDFYFGGDESPSNKAVSFRLNPNQIKSFFEELKQLKTSAAQGDSLQICTHMALLEEKGSKRSDQPNFTLLMNVLKNGKAPIGDQSHYPLRPIKGLNQAISGNLADSLTQEWKKISAENLVQQLYLNGKISDAQDRIRHYTFNAQDTEAIYTFWSRNPNCGLFIYIGQYKEVDHVPFRVIIRLTPNPNTSPQGNNGDEENFEFAGQCPPVCQ
jgi:hypothetical protein